MRVILVNQRYGHTQTYVIKGWLKGLLSLCLLGAPVALGYLGYQLSVQSGEQVYAEQHASSHASPTAATDTAPPVDQEFNQADAELPEAGIIPLMTSPVDVDESTESLPLQWMASLVAIVPRQLKHFESITLLTYRHGRIIDPAAYLARVGH